MRLSLKSTALQVIYEIHILKDRHIGINGRLLGKEADKLLRADGIVENIYSVDIRRTGRRGKISRQNIHRGTLSRAVGAEESDDLALSDLK